MCTNVIYVGSLHIHALPPSRIVWKPSLDQILIRTSASSECDDPWCHSEMYRDRSIAHFNAQPTRTSLQKTLSFSVNILQEEQKAWALPTRLLWQHDPILWSTRKLVSCTHLTSILESHAPNSGSLYILVVQDAFEDCAMHIYYRKS